MRRDERRPREGLSQPAAATAGESERPRRSGLDVGVMGDLVRTFVDEVRNRRRLDLLDGLVAEDYELRNLADGSVAVRGRGELHAQIAEWRAAFPGLRLHETDHLASGDRAV